MDSDMQTDAMLDSKPNWLDRPVSSMTRVKWETTLYLILLVLALLTRFWDLGARALSHDESLHAYYAWELYRGQGFIHTPLMHGTLRFHLDALTYALFGADDFTTRIPAAISGVLLVLSPILLRRWLGRRGALITSFLILISPMLLYHARYIRDEPFMALFSVLMIWAMLSYFHQRAAKWLYTLAGLVALMYVTMEASFIYIAVFGFFVAAVAVYEVARDAGWGRAGLAGSLLGLGAALAIFAADLLIGARIVGGFHYGAAEDGSPPSVLQMIPALVVIAVVGVIIGGGAFWVLRRLMPAAARRSPGFSLAVILGALSLFMLSTAGLAVLNVGAQYVREGDNFKFDPTAGTTTVWGTLSGERTTVFVDPYFFANGNFPTDPDNLTNLVRLLFLFVCFAALAMAIGLWWNPQVWWIAIGLFGGIGVTLFTTIFTNGVGLGTGFVGSLGYWLAQQAVNRGTQPEGYHLFIGLMYEYLPMLLTIAALIIFSVRYARGRSNTLSVENPDRSDRLAVPLLMTFVVMLWLGFTVAGEKMPWHMTHLAPPMILIGGRLLGEWLERIDWRGAWARREWLAVPLFPVLALAVLAALSSLATVTGVADAGSGTPNLAQLSAIGGLLSGALVSAIILAALVVLLRRSNGKMAWHLAGVSGFVVLSLMTTRTAYMFSYVNYDYPTEFGVFAHGGPGLKIALSEIEQLSLKLTGTPNQIEVLYDAEATWPWLWYLRDFPNKRYVAGSPSRADASLPVMILSTDNWATVDQSVGSNYNWFQFHRIWWPTYDYNRIPEIVKCPDQFVQPDGQVDHYAAYDENGDGSIDPVEFTNGDTRCAQRSSDLLRAFWNVFFFRDYALYAKLTGQQMTAQNWPFQSDFRLYVRKDLAARVWDQSIGVVATTGGTIPEPTTSNPYEAKWRDVAAAQIVGSAGSEDGQFSSPHGIAVAPNGSIYVADSNNHRVVKFDKNGKYVSAFGTWSGDPPDGNPLTGAWNPPGGTFIEPWDVAVGPDGSVYVADLWNSRVQKFDANGRFIKLWGGYGNSGNRAEGEEGRFYGPRGIAVGRDGRVYVADTGNKRVQVFDADGNFLLQFGGGGLLDGNLDEPVGLAVNNAGEVIVADTWNGRIQVFSADGQALRKWNIEGWLDLAAPDFGQSKVGKPYLGVGPDGRVYVADQVGSQILVFNADGRYVAAFGKLGSDESSFAAPSGVAVDAQGNILIIDTGNARVMLFPPIDKGPDLDVP